MGQTTSEPSVQKPVRANSVQGYIDESPLWADGTIAPPSPLTQMQQRIWWLSVAGKFFEGLVVFMTGVALPLIAKEFDLSNAQHGVVGAATLCGILVGASALGGLSDLFGRKPMFIFEMGLFTLFLVLIVFTQNFVWLLVCLFGMGLALGCDYPTANLMISESTATRKRGGLVLAAFGFQAVGALVGTALGYLILSADPDLHAWRWMYATAIGPAALVLIRRFSVTESAHWLAARGRKREAEDEILRLLQRKPPYPNEVRLIGSISGARFRRAGAGGYRDLFHVSNLRAIVLSAVPWWSPGSRNLWRRHFYADHPRRGGRL